MNHQFAADAVEELVEIALDHRFLPEISVLAAQAELFALALTKVEVVVIRCQLAEERPTADMETEL